MQNIQNLLQRIKNALNIDSLDREIFSKSIEDATGIKIDTKDISIKGENVYIKTSPAKRNEISLKETKILDSVRAQIKINLKKILY